MSIGSFTASAVSLVLIALAALHAYWGLGGVWPGDDPRSAAMTVAGFKGIQAMPPPLACFAVAGVLTVAAMWVQALAGGITAFPKWLVVLGGIAMAFVFLARGVAAYLPAWRQITPEQPFASYDVTLYGPLCLALGAAVAALTWARISLK
jgi:hypothetical protein